MNMIVKCSVRLKERTGGKVLGYDHDSNLFKAGVYPDKFQYQVQEGKSTLISFTATVNPGCGSLMDFQLKQCKVVLYITQPQSKDATGACLPNNILEDLVFLPCGLTIFSDSSKQTIQFNVTGYIDGQYNVNGKRDTVIRLSTNGSSSDPSGAWDNITIPIIQVLVSDEDEKMKNHYCEVFNDPHFYTADRTKYDYHGAGEHILYNNTKYPNQVNAIFTKCANGGHATCNCGIAIQSGKSLFVVRTCNKVSREIYYRGLSMPYIEKRICDDRGMSINNSHSSGNIYVVTLPIGTEITFEIRGEFISYINIKPSILDLDSAEGLCGYVSNSSKDDFRKRGETNATKNLNDFAKSWMVKTNESLFNENVKEREETKDLPIFCTCGGTEKGDMRNNYHLQCNISQPTYLCYNQLNSKCSGSRKKRATDDTDDVNEFPSLNIMPDVYNDSFVPETPIWHNGWSSKRAEATCRDYFDINFPVVVREASGITPEDYISSCIADIQIFGDERFMPVTLSVMQTSAKAELSRNQSLSEQKSEDGISFLEKLTSHLCLNNCSSNGQCKSGFCVCKEQFGGDDCSKPRSIPPTNVRLPNDGLCNIRKRACKKSNVYGYFMPPDVYYKFRHFEMYKNTRSYTGTFTEPLKATVIHSYMVSCELSNWRKKRATNSGIALAEGYEIRVSNDGTSFGEVVTFLVYDEECFSCEAVNVTCIYLDSCPTAVPTDQTTVGSTDEYTLPRKTNNDNLTTASESVDLASTGITGQPVNYSLLETTTKSFPMTTRANADHTSPGLTGIESTFTNTTETYTTTTIASVDYTITGMTGTVANSKLPETTKETYTTTSNASVQKTAAEDMLSYTTTTFSSNTTSENIGKTAEVKARTDSQHILSGTTTKSTRSTRNVNVVDTTAGMIGTTAKYALSEKTTTPSSTTINDETTEGITRQVTKNKLLETTTNSSPTTTSANVDDTTAGRTGRTEKNALPETTTKTLSTTTSAHFDETTAGTKKSTTVKHTFQETTPKSLSTIISASVDKTTVELSGTADQHTSPGSTTENYQTTAEQQGKEEKEKSDNVLLVSLIVAAVLVIGTIGAILVRLCLRSNTNAYEVAKKSSNMENVHTDEIKNGSTDYMMNERGDSKTTKALGNFTNFSNA